MWTVELGNWGNILIFRVKQGSKYEKGKYKCGMGKEDEPSGIRLELEISV